MAKVIDLVVGNDLCIGCGLCTFKCPVNALKMQWNEYGYLVPVQSGTCEGDGSCLIVCPFNPYPEKEVQTENEISNIFLKGPTLSHPKVGKYQNVYAGYSKEFRLTSSSGGMATFIMADLLERGLVNHIFSVKGSRTSGVHYEYAVSTSKQELLAASKTKYYPVTLSTVFSKIDKLNGKIAIVGVACFIKAIRLAQHSDPSLKEKIPFLVGIICGGVKSRFFVEYLSDKAGVQKENCIKPEFRIKDPGSMASDYSFGCYDNKDNKKKIIKMRTVGDMWGTGLFKANACDYCDDITAELADISLGDAWLNPFIKDGNGTNVVVTRSTLAEIVIKDGLDAGKIHLEELPMNRFLSSQQGSFNHRHLGLPYRIKRAIKAGQLVPPKRFEKGSLLIFDFKFVQLLRMIVRKKSLEVWKKECYSIKFDKELNKILYALRIATLFSQYKRVFLSKLKSFKKDEFKIES